MSPLRKTESVLEPAEDLRFLDPEVIETHELRVPRALIDSRTGQTVIDKQAPGHRSQRGGLVMNSVIEIEDDSAEAHVRPDSFSLACV